MIIGRFNMDTPLATLDANRRHDIDTIVSLWKQIGGGNTEQVEHDTEFMRSIMSGLEYIVAREPIDDRQKIVGAVSVIDCSNRLAKIDSLAVSPDYQRSSRRYGSKLAETAVDLCWSQGFKQITALAMPSSRKIFSRLGFEPENVYDSGNALMFLDK